MKPGVEDRVFPEFSEKNSATAMACLAFSMGLGSLGVSIPYVALPALAEAFGASFEAVQWVVVAYLLSTTVLVVIVGRLADLIGAKPVLLAGLLVFAASSIICGVSSSLAVLVIGRALQGVGGAVLLTLSLAMTRRVAAPEQAGRAMGLLGTSSAIGTGLGPMLGGLLVDTFSWSAVFLALAPPALLAFWAASRFLPPETPQRLRLERLDLPGALALTGCLLAGTLALSHADGDEWRTSVALLAAAIVCGSLLAFIERRAAAPVIPLSELQESAFCASLAANALAAAVIISTLVVGPIYLTLSFGLDAALVGMVVAAGPIISALSGVPAGRLVDRWGADKALGGGLGQMALGMVALALAPRVAGLAGYLIALCILTPGYQLFLAGNNARVLMNAPETRRGAVSGLLTLARNLGLTVGASLAAAVFSFSAGSDIMSGASPAAVAFGATATFLLGSILMLIALVIVLRTQTN